MLRFLVDESTGMRISEELEHMGFDSVSVIEVMNGAEDIEIVKKAKKEKWVIVTVLGGWFVTLQSEREIEF